MPRQGFFSKSKMASLKLVGGKKHLYEYFSVRDPEHITKSARLRSISDIKRHKWHFRFLKAHSAEIKVFADIGPASNLGAPTTFVAKKALGKGSRVFAVDILKFDPEHAKGFLPAVNSPFFPFANQKAKTANQEIKLKPTDITPVSLAISRNPLTTKIPLCDAIRFAIVSIYMTPNELLHTLYNISRSLGPRGYLLSEYHIFQKTPRGFRLVQTRPWK